MFRQVNDRDGDDAELLSSVHAQLSAYTQLRSSTLPRNVGGLSSIPKASSLCRRMNRACMGRMEGQNHVLWPRLAL